MNKSRKGSDIITLQQRVKASCELAGINLSELAGKLGMSQQNFSKRLKVGKFTQEELEKIAEALGAKYITAFEFPNGTRI